MIKSYGFKLLQEQILGAIEGEMMWMEADVRVGDSEIERLMFLALTFKTSFVQSEFTSLLQAKDDDVFQRLLIDSPEPWCSLFVRPQAKIGDYRVDFLIYAADMSRRPDRVWRRLIIECDGHDFHERTKEQSTRDKSRDRDLIMRGYEVFRFTGSELWRDPLGCADQVVSWAVKSW
jgi:very-short-patch-repair endonuclease